MSVYVTDFSRSPWRVIHDDAPGGAHSGTVLAADIQHGTNMDGTLNHNFLTITCPVCGAVSSHPAGGGAQPQSVQQMFVNVADASGCPCGQVAAGDPAALGESHVHLQCARMDGPSRWVLG